MKLGGGGGRSRHPKTRCGEALGGRLTCRRAEGQTREAASSAGIPAPRKAWQRASAWMARPRLLARRAGAAPRTVRRGAAHVGGWPARDAGEVEFGEVGSGGGHARGEPRGSRRERARAPEPAGERAPRPLERQVQRKRVSWEVAAGEGRGRRERKEGEGRELGAGN